jgi:hypothetical protein
MQKFVSSQGNVRERRLASMHAQRALSQARENEERNRTRRFARVQTWVVGCVPSPRRMRQQQGSNAPFPHVRDSIKSTGTAGIPFVFGAGCDSCRFARPGNRSVASILYEERERYEQGKRSGGAAAPVMRRRRTSNSATRTVLEL